MGRKRKYSNEEYPTTVYVKIPLALLNKLQAAGYDTYKISKALENSKIVEQYLTDLAQK